MSNPQEAVQAAAESFSEELENGIFSLVVTMCQQRALQVGADQAKKEAAEFLNKLIEGLLYEEPKPETINTKKDI